VHPDKCSHPQAHQAFVKLNKAFKDLQDPEKVSFLNTHGIYAKFLSIYLSYAHVCVSLIFFDKKQKLGSVHTPSTCLLLELKA
jgi:curved DNA-binding protein CbpA